MLRLNENKYRPALAPPAPRCRWDITDPRPPLLGTWWRRTPWHITGTLWYLTRNKQEECLVRTRPVHLPIASETEKHEKPWMYNKMKLKTYSLCWPFLSENWIQHRSRRTVKPGLKKDLNQCTTWVTYILFFYYKLRILRGHELHFFFNEKLF